MKWSPNVAGVYRWLLLYLEQVKAYFRSNPSAAGVFVNVSHTHAVTIHIRGSSHCGDRLLIASSPLNRPRNPTVGGRKG